jgi:hypothetical protein
MTILSSPACSWYYRKRGSAIAFTMPISFPIAQSAIQASDNKDYER